MLRGPQDVSIREVLAVLGGPRLVALVLDFDLDLAHGIIIPSVESSPRSLEPAGELLPAGWPPLRSVRPARHVFGALFDRLPSLGLGLCLEHRSAMLAHILVQYQNLIQ